MDKQQIIIIGLLVVVILIGVSLPFFLLDVSEVGSKDHKVFSINKAIETIGNLPEVKAWKVLVKKANTEDINKKSEAVIVLDKEIKEGYVIHVYESFSDHTATFGWYTVDKITGSVANSSE